MKSLTAVCQTGASMPAMNPSGRVQRHPPHRGDGENAEMKMYLSKLKDLVPFMPKNRKLSKLEIIQHVIDYICDLQSELETHPGMGGAHGAAFDAASALNYDASSVAVVSQLIQQQQQQHADDSDAGEMDDAEEEQAGDEEDQMMAMQAAERLSAASTVQHLQRQSSRQPLVDRQAPNTILPHTPATVTATNNTTTTATANSSSSNSAVGAQQPPQQMTSTIAVAAAPAATTTASSAAAQLTASSSTAAVAAPEKVTAATSQAC